MFVGGYGSEFLFRNRDHGIVVEHSVDGVRAAPPRPVDEALTSRDWDAARLPAADFAQVFSTADAALSALESDEPTPLSSRRTFRPPKKVVQAARTALYRRSLSDRRSQDPILRSLRSLAAGSPVTADQVRNIQTSLTASVTPAPGDDTWINPARDWADKSIHMLRDDREKSFVTLTAATTPPQTDDDFFAEAKDSKAPPEPENLPAQNKVPDDLYTNADHVHRTSNYEVEDYRAPHGFEPSPIDHYVCMTCGRLESETDTHPEESQEAPVTAAAAPVPVVRIPQIDPSLLSSFLSPLVAHERTKDPARAPSGYFVELSPYEEHGPGVIWSVMQRLGNEDEGNESWLSWGMDGKWHPVSEPDFSAPGGFGPCDGQTARIVALAQASDLSEDGGIHSVRLEDVHPEEFQYAVLATEDPELHEELQLAALAAAGPVTNPEGTAVPKVITDPEAVQDDGYTPVERSQNASKQIRDRMGRFARGGSHVALGDGTHGVITGIDPTTQTVTVRLDGTGQEVQVPAKGVQKTKGVGKATLSQPLPVLTTRQLHSAIDAYEAYVVRERAKAGNQQKASDAAATLAAAPPEAPDEAPPAATGAMTPDNSDVKPLYMAIVDQFDQTAVLEMVALVPVTASSPRPIVYRREAGRWVQDIKILRDLKGATPPPVVVLQEAEAEAVKEQIDTASVSEASNQAPIYGEFGEILTAAGGWDRNRGNAENFRRYWTVGKGGTTKIRWMQPGSWTRCYHHLFKYLGPRAAGYCQLRLKEMHGHYSGSKEHRKGLSAGGAASDMDPDTSVVVVAVPAPEDPSRTFVEDPAEAHMTMLFLGDASNLDEAAIGTIREAVARAASGIDPNGIDAPGQGLEVLGPDDDRVDVVRVDPGTLRDAREELLSDETVRANYDANDQYPEWVPHVTLGPTTHDTTRLVPDNVTFAGLGLWIGPEKEFVPFGGAS